MIIELKKVDRGHRQGWPWPSIRRAMAVPQAWRRTVIGSIGRGFA